MSTPIDAMSNTFLRTLSNNNDLDLLSSPPRALAPTQFSTIKPLLLTPIQRVNTISQTPTFSFLSPFTSLQSASKSNFSSPNAKTSHPPKCLFSHHIAEMPQFQTMPTSTCKFDFDTFSYISDSDEDNTSINTAVLNLEEDNSLGSTDSVDSTQTSEELINSFFASLPQNNSSVNPGTQSEDKGNNNRKRVLAPIDNLQTTQSTGTPLLMLKQASDTRQEKQNGTSENSRKFPPAQLRPRGWIPKPTALPQVEESDSENDINKENEFFLKDKDSHKKQKFGLKQ